MRSNLCRLGLSVLVVYALLARPLGAQIEPGQLDVGDFAGRITALVGTEPAQWRVVWHKDPRTEATISWSTREAGSEHRVQLARSPIEPGASEFERTVASAANGPYTAGRGEPETPAAYYHHARLDGLVPGTRYWFVIESDGARSRVLHFDTAPEHGFDFDVLYGGDSRSNWRDRCRMNLLVAEFALDDRVLCFVHGGDYVMYGTDSRQWVAWLGHNELTTTAQGRVLPIVPARGNHDFGPNYGEVFDWPGTEYGAWFRTDLSSDVVLLNLDTNASALGDQLLWIDAQLGDARATSRWLLVNYHRPMFPAVKTPSPAAPHWVPLFESHDVDLVFESDGHCMKRTAPIRAGAVDSSGVTYIGEGGLGVPQRIPDGSRWYLANGGWVGRGHHVTRVVFGVDTLTTRFVALCGSAVLPANAATSVAESGPWSHSFVPVEGDAWKCVDFDDSSWAAAPGPFGFADGATTDVTAMRGASACLYTRARFETTGAESVDGRVAALVVDYDDSFVAHIDGREVARSGFDGQSSWDHPSGIAEVFALPELGATLAPGPHVLAIEGHNFSARNSDFHLGVRLVWLTTTELAEAALGGLVVDENVLHARALALHR